MVPLIIPRRPDPVVAAPRTDRSARLPALGPFRRIATRPRAGALQVVARAPYQTTHEGVVCGGIGAHRAAGLAGDPARARGTVISAGNTGSFLLESVVMCRLAAYLGPPLSLARFLLAPAHGLVQQSYAPREMREARVNADGYGVGWRAPDGSLARLTYGMPIWADHNLPTLAAHIAAPMWVANVRSATTGFANHPANTQPYLADGLLFLHNGYLVDFPAVRARLRRVLSPEIECSIEGTTDSEYVFALLRQVLATADFDIPEALRETARRLFDEFGVAGGLLNIVVTDGERIHALRHALGAAPPTLYFTIDDEEYPNAALVASEPLTEGAYWQTVPEHHILTVDGDKPAQLISL